jgi:YD repeat-containing protein
VSQEDGIVLLALLVALLLAVAQTETFRDASGRITGTARRDANGTVTYRDGSGRMTGTSTRDANGTRTFRDANGRTTGTASGPRR